MKRRGKPLHSGRRGAAEVNTGLVATHEYAFDPEASTENSQLCGCEHRLRGNGKRPEAVAQLGPKRLELVGVLDSREATVDVQLGFVRRDEVVREIVREIDGYIGRDELRRAIAL